MTRDDSPAGKRRVNDAVFLLDDSGFIDCNRDAEGMFGATRAQLLHKMPYQLSPPVQPDGLRSRQKALEKMRLASEGSSQWFEWRHRKRDGTLFDTEVGLNRVVVEGKPVLLAVVRDIYERKKAEADLLRAHEELESRVAQRTAQLSEANRLLQSEVSRRTLVEEALRRERDQATIIERNRLARDLHDAVSQTLFSASLISEVLPRLWGRDVEEGRRRLEEVRQLTRGALAEMRTLLLELRPDSLVEAEIEPLLKQLAESITGRSRVPVNLSITGRCAMPVEVKIALYRIAQEALNNVAKHAGAGLVDVRLSCRASRVTLSVSDDGKGFDMKKLPPNTLGLNIMRERAREIGAAVSVRSRPGAGTRVRVAWNNASVEAENE